MEAQPVRAVVDIDRELRGLDSAVTDLLEAVQETAWTRVDELRGAFRLQLQDALRRVSSSPQQLTLFSGPAPLAQSQT